MWPWLALKCNLFGKQGCKGHRDTQHNDVQYGDTQYNNTRHNN